MALSLIENLTDVKFCTYVYPVETSAETGTGIRKNLRRNSDFESGIKSKIFDEL